ncbi:MAG: TetR/AcrR family transcriptional regulator [Acidimicrobiales bacterium]
MEAAQELLDKAGYNSLTIDGVAARAGVGRPTIYRRWPSKAALVIGALGGRPMESDSLPDTGNLREDLLAIHRLQLELLSSSEGQRVLPGLAADMADHPELHPRFYERYVAPWREAVQAAVERAAARGEIPEGPDGRLVADVLTGPLVFRMLLAGERLDERALEPAVDLILVGLARSNGNWPANGSDNPAAAD